MIKRILAHTTLLLISPLVGCDDPPLTASDPASAVTLLAVPNSLEFPDQSTEAERLDVVLSDNDMEHG